MNHKRLLLVLTSAALIVGVPVAARWARRDALPRCALAGLKIEPLYRVRIVDRQGGTHEFCCVRCAGLWRSRQNEPATEVYVTDETTGAEIPAGAAHFVHSAVVTNPITGNRVHAFALVDDAERHARAFAGLLLTGRERPF